MKLKSIFPIVLIFVFLSNLAHAVSETEKVRAASEIQRAFASFEKPDNNTEALMREEAKDALILDWIRMSEGRQESYVLDAISRLQDRGIWPMNSPAKYVELIKQRLGQDPSLTDKTVTEALALILHDAEPDSNGQA